MFKLAAMAALHAAVVSMMTAGSWKVSKSRGLPPPVAQTMMGLLVKATKTFRAIHVLCERGLHGPAGQALDARLTSALMFS